MLVKKKAARSLTALPNSVPIPNTAPQAIARLGAIATMVNPLYTEYELSSQMRQSGAKAVIAHVGTLDTAEKAVRMVVNEGGRPVEHLVVLGADSSAVPEGAISLDSMKASANPIWETVAGVAGDDLVALPFSSGTTGLPKGTMLTHDNIVVRECHFICCFTPPR